MRARLSGTSRIHRLPGLPEDAPELAVLAADRALDIAEAFRSPRPAEAPAECPLVLRVRLETLNTPDTIELITARVAGASFEFEVEHRAFEGILGANVQSTAVLEAPLGALAPGQYEVIITTHVLGFSRLDHPAEAQPRTRTSRSLSFSVKPQ